MKPATEIQHGGAICPRSCGQEVGKPGGNIQIQADAEGFTTTLSRMPVQAEGRGIQLDSQVWTVQRECPPCMEWLA